MTKSNNYPIAEFWIKTMTTTAMQLLHSMNDIVTAELYARASHENARKLYPADHPQISACLNILGLIAFHNKKFTQAEEYFLESLAIVEKTYGEGHHNSAPLLYNLSSIFHALGNYPAAQMYHDRASRISATMHGPGSHRLKNLLANLSIVHRIETSAISEEQGRASHGYALSAYIQ